MGAAGSPLRSNSFIALDRTFRALVQGQASDDVEHHPLVQVGDKQTWRDLTKERRVVVLSEAGSGKTAEIRHLAETLRQEGKPAFFLRLEHVAHDFDIAFEVGSLDTFNAWVASVHDGWVLLDSIDEARLKSPADFERAVRRVAQRLGTARQRAHIVLTGRVSAWRPLSDLALVQQHLPYVPNQEADSKPSNVGSEHGEEGASPTQEKPGAVKVVALNDLTDAQVRIFARARGVTDPGELLDALERADGLTYAARPQDLIEIIEFWIANRRIGRRLDLMRSSIDRRLAERDQNRAEASVIAPERLREGARLVASVVTLSKQQAIGVPDGAAPANGLDVREVLPGWSAAEIGTLLARPIFDEAIYGAVRFHHRSVREYLTAEWCAELLKRQTSRLRVEELFFRKQYDVDIVVPTMRPILPWLAILDAKILERVLKLAPEILFEGGDPSQLPVEVRRRVLTDVCTALAGEASERSMLDYSAVQRFANVDLEQDVRALLVKHAHNKEVIPFLMRLAWHGRMHGLMDEALTIACTTAAGHYSRLTAIRVVMSLGSKVDQDQLLQRFLNEAPELDRRLVSEVIDGLKATEAEVDWLLKAIEKTTQPDPHQVDALAQSLAEFVRRSDVRFLPRLIDGLDRLARTPPVVERRHCEVSTRYLWVLKPAGIAVERLLQDRHDAAFNPATLSLLRSIPVAQSVHGYSVGDDKLKLDELVAAWPELNLALFWSHIEEARQDPDRKPEQRVDSWWDVHAWPSFVTPATLSLVALIEAARSCPHLDDRLAAMDMALRLWTDGGKPSECLPALHAAATEPELQTLLNRFLNPPPPSTEMLENEQSVREHKRRMKQRQEELDRNRAQSRAYVIDNVEAVRNPGFSDPSAVSQSQWYLYEHMRREGGSVTSRGTYDWRSLIPEFGVEVAEAFRDGVVAFWRRHRPKTRATGAEPNTTPCAALIGLTGLAIESRETPEWGETLTPDAASTAFAYAMHEINGFPEWLPGLVDRFPDQLVPLILQEIEHELSVETEGQDSHYILSDLVWRGDWSWIHIAEPVFDILSSRQATNVASLRRLTAIMQGSTLAGDRIAELALACLSTEIRPAHRAHWHAVWTATDPQRAIPALEQELASLNDHEAQTLYAMRFITDLVGGRRGEPSRMRPTFRTPEHLLALYTLMHRYIRRADDIERAGKGVYSPEMRDDAQEARDRLFGLMKETPGKAAYLALQALIEHHPDEQARPWFRVHAKNKAEADGDLQPWKTSEVREFTESLERTPHDHRSLFELACHRLLDLKADLEQGDDSVASILRKIDQETEVRKFIGGWCRDRTLGRYSIPQEEELADAKKPDMRWHGNGFDAPVPVELKLADNWSGPDLVERLQNQLCGDYLRDSRSSRGVFALVYRGAKTRWELPGVGSVSFPGLVEALQEHWASIAASYPNVDEVSVIGIDLTVRERAMA